MPSVINFNPSPDYLPDGWTRPSKPDAEKAFILRYDYQLPDADAAYWSGYSKLTASCDPRCWKRNGNIKKLLANRGISKDVIKVETESDLTWVLNDLREELRIGNFFEKSDKLGVLDRFAHYLKLRCQVAGVPLNKAEVTGGTDDDGNSQAITFKVVLPGQGETGNREDGENE